MCCCEINSVLELIQTFLTSLGILVAGGWALYVFIRQRENKPRIEMSADIIFYNKIDDWWIVELVVYIENKGKIQHKMYNLDFDLFSINEGDPVNLAEQFGNQAHFPNLIAHGSFKRRDMLYFFIEPGVKGKYSYITRVPANAITVLFHAWFDYAKINRAHVTEKTAIVPRQ